MANKTTPSKNVPGGTKQNVRQHERMAMGQRVTGQTLKKGGKVERKAGGRGC